MASNLKYCHQHRGFESEEVAIVSGSADIFNDVLDGIDARIDGIGRSI